MTDKILGKIKSELESDIGKSKVFCVGTYIILCVVSFVMTVLNIITNKGILTECTGIFAVLCIVNIALTLINEKSATVARFLFAVEVLAMFTFFLVSGNPEGFSAIWICMLPSLGMIFFGRAKGSLVCFVMFGILAFFLWTSFGKGLLMYDYTDSFKMRFPVLFIAFHALAYMLELLRSHAYSQMRKMREYFKELSVKDQLTGLLNRQGMYSSIENDKRFQNAESIGVAIFDIDDFKKVNDTYGHNAGDVVLSEFAEILKKNLCAITCRWGGEEFLAIYTDSEVTKTDLECVRHIVEAHTFEYENERFKVTVSVGMTESVSVVDVRSIDRFIEEADDALYSAKGDGKNRVVRYKKRN